MLSRKQFIEDLTTYELEYLVSNFDKHTLTEVSEFFANGGFAQWTDAQLVEKHNLFITENQNA